mgnify:CR=1 FL=1
MAELATGTKVAIIKSEIQLWMNSQYQAGLKLRVQTKLGNAQGIKEATDYFECCEQAIMELEKALGELNVLEVVSG